jgi:hypothetical protein
MLKNKENHAPLISESGNIRPLNKALIIGAAAVSAIFAGRELMQGSATTPRQPNPPALEGFNNPSIEETDRLALRAQNAWKAAEAVRNGNTTEAHLSRAIFEVRNRGGGRFGYELIKGPAVVDSEDGMQKTYVGRSQDGQISAIGDLRGGPMIPVIIEGGGEGRYPTVENYHPRENGSGFVTADGVVFGETFTSGDFASPDEARNAAVLQAEILFGIK